MLDSRSIKQSAKQTRGFNSVVKTIYIALIKKEIKLQYFNFGNFRICSLHILQ